MPELRHLRAFVAVAEERNFTRAAEKLSYAQQAISKAVAQLELELGVSLLRRTSHDVELTPAGTALLETGRRVLAAADAAFDGAQAVGRGIDGTLHIGCTPAVGPGTRREIRRLLHDKAPKLSIAFREIRPHEVDRVLLDREAGFVLARTHRAHPDLDMLELDATPAWLCVPAGHRLATASAVRLADLDGERLLTWNPVGTPYTDHLVDQLAKAGARVEAVVSRVTGGEDPPELREAGAVAFLPAGWRAGDAVVHKPMEGEEVQLPLLMLWRTGDWPPPFAGSRSGWLEAREVTIVGHPAGERRLGTSPPSWPSA